MHHSVKRMSRFVVHFVEFPERAFGIVLMRVPIQLVKSDALRCTMQGPAWCCLHVVISRLRSLLALLSATDLNFMWCVDSWWLRWHSPPPPCWFSWACISKQKQDSFHRWQQKSYAVSKSFKCTAASKRTASFRADWLHYFDKETTWQMWFSRTEIDTDKITVLPLLPDKRDV